VEGKPDLPRTSTFVRLVSADYFATMGIAVRRGRALAASDVRPAAGDTSGGVVVINEALANKYFGGEDPVGRRISAGFSPKLARIVGVVQDVAEGALTDGPAPVRYTPYESLSFISTGQTLVFHVSRDRDPAPFLTTVRETIRRVAPRVPVAEATTMEQVFAHAVGPARQTMLLLTLLTTLALVLCATGIYGVISHFVARRKRDWGIRIALGLRPTRVVSGIVSHGVALVVLGVVLGLVAFVALARFLSSLLYGVGTTDPLAVLASITVLLLVGVLAALLPAARASRTDPAVVLRQP
jgi:ABC-type antimicrobial peptide transport system permease subunit